MYSNQGGKTLELFTAHGRDPLAKVQLTGGRTVKKEFDPLIKGYVLSLNGSPATSRVHLPKSDKKGMGLIHSYLLMQFFIPQDSRALIELIILDTTNCKRKLQLLSWQQEVSVNPLSVKIPLPAIPNEWHWLLIDLPDLMTSLISQSYQSLESLSVCGSCKIRSIATVRDFITSPGDLPSSWQPPPSVPPLNMYVVNSNLFSSSVPHTPHTKSEAASMHIAFGEKIAIPSHVARTQQRKAETDKQQVHSRTTESKANPRTTTLRPVTLKPTDNICIDSVPKEKELISQTNHFAYVSPPHSIASSKTRSNSQETVSQKAQSHSRETHSYSQGTHSHSRETRSHSEETRSHSEETRSHSEETRSHFQAPENISHIQTQTVYSGTRDAVNLEEDFLSLSAINGGSPKRDPLTSNEDGNYHWEKYHSDASNNTEDDDNVSDTESNDDGLIVKTNEMSPDSRSGDPDSIPVHAPLHASIDDSEMGGPSTPTKQSLSDNIPTQSETDSSSNQDENLELLYDPDLNYFYDPKTGKCYELAH